MRYYRYVNCCKLYTACKRLYTWLDLQTIGEDTLSFEHIKVPFIRVVDGQTPRPKSRTKSHALIKKSTVKIIHTYISISHKFPHKYRSVGPLVQEKNGYYGSRLGVTRLLPGRNLVMRDV